VTGNRQPCVPEVERGLQDFGEYLASFERLAPSTVRTYVRQCRLVFQGLPQAGERWWPIDIGVPELRGFMRREAGRGFSASTLRNRLLSLSAYYRFLHHSGYDRESPLRSVRAPRPTPVEREFYSDEDVERILSYASSSANRREPLAGVILATFNYTGLRLDELVRPRRDHVDLRSRRLRVVGKGNRSRTVPMPHVLVEVLDDYMTGLRPTLAASPFVFVNPRSQPDGLYRGVI
jgi:integrase/recombinase XerC